MGIQLTSKAITRPEKVARAVRQRVSGPFKGKVLRQFKNFKALHFEPFLEMRFLALPFTMEKTAQDKFLADHKSGIGSENHVRQPRLRPDAFHSRVLLEQGAESLPLACRRLA